MVLIDSHNHLHDERLRGQRGDIVSTCEKLGIVASVVNGTSPGDWEHVAELAKQHAWIVPSFGVHPWYINDLPESWVDTLIHFLDSTPSAVGEVGIDGWRKEFDTRTQEEIFLRQLSLAAERNLPISIHGLRRWGRLLELLKTHPRPQCGFLLHSYGGPSEMVTAFANLGGYFSCPGFFLQAGREMKLRVFKDIPSDRLLLETDAPDQNLPEKLDRYSISSSIQPHNRVNHPANIRTVYEKVADFLGTSSDQLAEQITRNFHALFGGVLSSRGSRA